MPILHPPKFLPPVLALCLASGHANGALLLKYGFEGSTLLPTVTTDPGWVTGGPLTADLPATVGQTSNTTSLRRYYFADLSSYDNDVTLAVKTRWEKTTPLFRVQAGRTDLDAAIANNSFFTITLDPQRELSLASLAFDISGSANEAYPFGMTVRSSLTGTTNLFSTSYIAGLDGAPDFVAIDLGAHPELQEFTGDVTFTFYLYAADRLSNVGIDNITFSSVPEPGGALLASMGAIGMLMKRRRVN